MPLPCARLTLENRRKSGTDGTFSHSVRVHIASDPTSSNANIAKLVEPPREISAQKFPRENKKPRFDVIRTGAELLWEKWHASRAS